MTTASLLDGVEVVEVGNAVAGSVAGMLLRDAGATVVKAPLRPLDEPGHIRAAFAQWDLGKASVANDKLAAALETADVVIDQAWCAGRRAVASTLESIRARRSGIYCTITHGLDAAVDGLGIADFESVLAAAAGVFSSAISGQAIGGVAFVDVPIASVATAIHIVTAIAIARASAATSDITISMVDVPPFQKGVEFSRSDHLTTVQATQMGASGMYCTGDGRWIQLDAPSSRITTRLWHAVHDAGLPVDGLAALTQPLVAVTAAEAQEVRAALTALFQTRPAHEWEQRLSAADVPCGICRTTDEWKASVLAVACGAVDRTAERWIGPMVR